MQEEEEGEEELGLPLPLTPTVPLIHHHRLVIGTSAHHLVLYLSLYYQFHWAHFVLRKRQTLSSRVGKEIKKRIRKGRGKTEVVRDKHEIKIRSDVDV